MLKKFLALLIPGLGLLAFSFKNIKELLRPEKPNIVLILSDDQAWTDYSFMGHPHIQTPNIDKLAVEGLTFTRGYVPTSLCSPSLASIATGLYPSRHGVLGNDRVLETDNPKKVKEVRARNMVPLIQDFEKLTTLPDVLKKEGYLSFQTGKWWIGNPKSGGFDYGMTHGDTLRGGRHGDQGLKIGREGLQPIKDYLDIAKKEDKPFFLWYAPFLPHEPHTPPDSLFQKYKSKAPSEYVAKYWAMCEWFDSTCGQLVNMIEDEGLRENTIFVYVCDNGWIQKENSHGYTPNSKRSPYDFGTRTPIILNWKGKIQANSNKNDLVSSIDIMPTLLKLLGIKADLDLDGIDVLSAKALAQREAIFGEIYEHDFHTIENSHKYDIVYQGHHKLIVPNKKRLLGEKTELFNLKNDPYEEKNLALQNPEKVGELLGRIEKKWNAFYENE